MLSEILLVGLGFVILFLELFFNSNKNHFNKFIFHVTWTGLAIIAGSLYLRSEINGTLFGTYVVSPSNTLTQILFAVSALATILLARLYFTKGGDNKEKLEYPSEFFSMICFVTLGSFIVVGSTNLLTLFVGLELATIPLYFLSAYDKKRTTSSEAGFKYILMGSLSTAITLFGFSYLYGFAGSLNFQTIQQLASVQSESPLLWLGVLFIFAGIGFKLTLFPFHMWAPDVYDGSPTPVTAFLSVSSKITAIAFLIVMFEGPFLFIYQQLTPVILLLSAFTMVVGNLGALKQTSFKRFMGYSSIAQAGYLLLAFSGPLASAKESLIFYLLIYAFTNYGLFYVFSLVGQKRGETFSALNGLSRTNPLLAAILSLCAFSLAGIPPVAGFIGKLMLFAAAAENSHYLMIVFASINSTVSLYYYLQLLKQAYIIDNDSPKEVLNYTIQDKLTLTGLSLGILSLGILPGWSTWVHEIIQGF